MSGHLTVTEGRPQDGARTLLVTHPEGLTATWVEDDDVWMQARGPQILGAAAAILDYLEAGYRQVRDGAELRAYLDREGERPEPLVVLDSLGRQVGDYDSHALAVEDCLIVERER